MPQTHMPDSTAYRAAADTAADALNQLTAFAKDLADESKRRYQQGETLSLIHI